MISIICPSRGRPTVAKNLIDTSLSTAQHGIEILLYLNDDDPTLEEYRDLISHEHIIVGKDRSPVYSYNKLAEISKGDICFLAADHVSFVKENWDTLVYDKFRLYKDNIAFVYPSVEHLPHFHSHITKENYDKPHIYEMQEKENIGNAKNMTDLFCPFYFLHKNWINTVGYFACPVFWHWFCDKYFLNVAQKIQRVEIIKERIIDSIPYKTDQTDRKKHDLCNRERDLWLWITKKTSRWMISDAQALQQFINEYQTTNSNIASGG